MSWIVPKLSALIPSGLKDFFLPEIQSKNFQLTKEAVQSDLQSILGKYLGHSKVFVLTFSYNHFSQFKQLTANAINGDIDAVHNQISVTQQKVTSTFHAVFDTLEEGYVTYFVNHKSNQVRVQEFAKSMQSFLQSESAQDVVLTVAPLAGIFSLAAIPTITLLQKGLNQTHFLQQSDEIAVELDDLKETKPTDFLDDDQFVVVESLSQEDSSTSTVYNF